MSGDEQNCMCCKEMLTTEFIFLHTPKAFQKIYMAKITKIDMMKEQLLLKSTQERLQAKTNIKMIKARISSSLKIQAVYQKHLKAFPEDHTAAELYTEISKLIDKSYEDCHVYRDILVKSDEEIHQHSNSFFCPTLSCNGLVARGRCGECKKKICVTCHEVVDNDGDSDGHVCDVDTLETIKLIKKETKPCPKCNVSIHKIDGCDQMFCTNCHTGFSWRTGQIQTRIHNPHYFEWLRSRAHETAPAPAPDEDPCGRNLQNALAFITSHYDLENDAYWFIPRVLEEINVILPILSSTIYNPDSISLKKQSLREKYIKQRGNTPNAERNWFHQLRLMFTRKEMIKDLIKIIEAFDLTLKDLVVDAHIKKTNLKILYKDVGALTAYTEEQLRKSEKRYDLKNGTSIVDGGVSCSLVNW